VKKLPMAALLPPQHPSLLVQPLQNLANFHCASVFATIPRVNAEQADVGPVSVLTFDTLVKEARSAAEISRASGPAQSGPGRMASRGPRQRVKSKQKVEVRRLTQRPRNGNERPESKAMPKGDSRKGQVP
jgi:hypothetical protein